MKEYPSSSKSSKSSGQEPSPNPNVVWEVNYCPQKRLLEFGEWLCEEVLRVVLHRHFIFSVPKILRKYFLHDRKLLSGAQPVCLRFSQNFLSNDRSWWRFDFRRRNCNTNLLVFPLIQPSISAGELLSKYHEAGSNWTHKANFPILLPRRPRDLWGGAGDHQLFNKLQEDGRRSKRPPPMALTRSPIIESNYWFLGVLICPFCWGFTWV